MLVYQKVSVFKDKISHLATQSEQTTRARLGIFDAGDDEEKTRCVPRSGETKRSQ